MYLTKGAKALLERVLGKSSKELSGKSFDKNINSFYKKKL